MNLKQSRIVADRCPVCCRYDRYRMVGTVSEGKDIIGSLENKFLRIVKALLPRRLFEHAFPFPSEMLVMGRKA